MMETVHLIGLAKVIITGAALTVGAFTDLRTRRVPDRLWKALTLACMPLLFLEMGELGGWDEPCSFLSLPLLAAGVLFVLYGYPEPKEVLRGKAVDLFFALFYLLSIAGGVAAYSLGDRALFWKVSVSFVFMLVYFLLYSVPIAGARLIHGGADAKCLIVLAALFPWYIEGFPISFGPFFDAVESVPAVGLIFNIHLSTLLNAAIITGAVLLVYMPLRNLVKGRASFPEMFTSYTMEVDRLEGSHVWVLMGDDGRRVQKVDIDSDVLEKLRRGRRKEVRVTPKIPFILSLSLAFIMQMLIGNLVLVLLI